MNSTLYPFGARLRDGCTVYECQNRDNCGKFVPVEWGKFFTTTKYGNIRYTLYRNTMFFFYLDLHTIQFSNVRTLAYRFIVTVLIL